LEQRGGERLGDKFLGGKFLGDKTAGVAERAALTNPPFTAAK
jgi:hypothetical protein